VNYGGSRLKLTRILLAASVCVVGVGAHADDMKNMKDRQERDEVTSDSRRETVDLTALHDASLRHPLSRLHDESAPFRCAT